jgi:micrococcal nuclease
MYEYSFALNRVVDGDTVDGVIDLGFGIFAHKRIRLLGIDAPETRLQSKIKDKNKRLLEKEAGLRAKARLVEMLSHEEILIRTQLDKNGKFGRVLGTLLTKEGENINKLLLSQGYVKEYKI